MARQLRPAALGALVAALVACTGVPDGITPVQGFELDRYLGTWYEIARLDHRFERGLRDVTADYRLLEDGSVEVINRGRQADGTLEEARGRARLAGDARVASLEVSFFGPFYGGYHVIALDREGYQWAMVCGPSRDYLWILARTPTLEAEVRTRLVARAEALGFATDELIFVEHEPRPDGNAR